MAVSFTLNDKVNSVGDSKFIGGELIAIFEDASVSIDPSLPTYTVMVPAGS